MYVAGLGRGYIRPLEYGDTIRYGEAERTPGLLAQLFSQAVVGLDVDARDVAMMRPPVPTLLEQAILEASDVAAATETDTPMDDRRDDSGTVEYRDDALLADPGESTDDVTEADQMYWLHDQGYTYDDIYGLLVAEIEQLRDGFKRAKERSGDAGDSGSGTSGPASGNRGDRAAQFGWR